MTTSALLMIAWAVVIIIILQLSYAVCRSFIWYGDEPLYKPLLFIENNINWIIPTVILAGWIVIVYIILRRALKYLNEITFEAEKLADPDAKPVHLSDELKGIQDELNSAREQSLKNSALAKEAEQRKNDLVVYLAHDLKTPLTSVIGYLSLLKDEKDISEETREKYTDIALSKANRLEELVNEFFEITRFNLSKLTLEYSTINLTLMLEQLVYEFGPVFDRKKLSAKLSAEEKVMLRCDPDKLSRVFDNLLRNAVNYSYEETLIEIRLITDDNFAYIFFSNSGATIPSDKLERIFEQFFRLDTSRATNSGGAGLGLAIAKQITELHGGKISATSENEITRFCVKLPKTQKALDKVNDV